MHHRDSRRAFLAIVILTGRALSQEPQDLSIGSESVPKPQAVVWRPESAATARVIQEKGARICCVAWSPDSTCLAGAREDGTLVLWDARTGRQLAARKLGLMLFTLAWSPDGRMIVTGGEDGPVKIVDVPSLALVSSLSAFDESVYEVAWSPEGTRLAIAGSGGIVRLWDTVENKMVDSIPVATESICALAWAPQGQLLAIRSQNEEVVLWDVSARRAKLKLSEEGLNGGTVAFSPMGDLFATASKEKKAVVRDLAGKALFEMDAPWAEVAWSAKGNLLAVYSSSRNTLTLVDTKTWKPLHSFRPHQDWVSSLSFTRDGTQLATASAAGKLALWDLRSLPAHIDATTPRLPAEATINGRYSEPLAVLSAPEDRAIFGDFLELGYRSLKQSTPLVESSGYWIYRHPNWHVFENSRIGLSRPPKTLPKPAQRGPKENLVWLYFSEFIICKQSFARAVVDLSNSVPWVRRATLRNAGSVVEVNLVDDVTTEQLLELLHLNRNWGLGDCQILTEADARQMGLWERAD